MKRRGRTVVRDRSPFPEFQDWEVVVRPRSGRTFFIPNGPVDSVPVVMPPPKDVISGNLWVPHGTDKKLQTPEGREISVYAREVLDVAAIETHSRIRYRMVEVQYTDPGLDPRRGKTFGKLTVRRGLVASEMPYFNGYNTAAIEQTARLYTVPPEVIAAAVRTGRTIRYPEAVPEKSMVVQMQGSRIRYDSVVYRVQEVRANKDSHGDPEELLVRAVPEGP